MKTVDWAKAINLEQAVGNVKHEISGDWHQDPWGWPELDYLTKKDAHLAYEHCAANEVFHASLIDIPKENWGTRPAVVLDILDRVAYQALVDRFSVDLIGDLSPNTFGWRLPAIDPSAGSYSHNSKQWDRYRGHLNFLGAMYPVALCTDLVSCFASMPIDLVQDAIDNKTPGGKIGDRLCQLIGGFGSILGRSGLAQRSTASAVIANMYLRPLDDALLDHSHTFSFSLPKGKKITYHSFVRWMDDVWLFGSDPASARRAQVDLQSVAQSLGLHLNAAKTDVFEDDEVSRHVREIEHSAVSDAIKSDGDFTPLEELVDRLLAEPERASRTSVRFIAKRMRENGYVYRGDDLLDLAKRMPHVSDSLSRLFKEFYTSQGLEDWYLDYAESDWATHEWSVSQFGRIFPSGSKPGRKVRQFFGDKVRDANTSLPLLALAAQRLCSWDAAEGRAACRDAYSRAGTPHARRVLALAALGVGETRPTIRTWLSKDKENQLTSSMLESSGFKPPKIEKDFMK